jgi:hypothetical protein
MPEGPGKEELKKKLGRLETVITMTAEIFNTSKKNKDDLEEKRLEDEAKNAKAKKEGKLTDAKASADAFENKITKA